MCQLLGMNANTPTDVMFSFTGLATRADEHKDGFGIAFFEDRGLRLLRRPRRARATRRWPRWCRRYPIKSDNVIAHIRKATQGRVALENTPPLRARAVGPLLGVRAQRRPEGLRAAAARRLPPGRRHRQRARLLLADAGAGQGARQRAERRRAERARCASWCRGWPRTARFNLLLSNGQALWAHCSTQLHWLQRQHPFRRATLADEDLSVDFAALTTPTRPRRRGRHRAADAPTRPGRRSRRASCASSSTATPRWRAARPG